jgi:hypothetical protein
MKKSKCVDCGKIRTLSYDTKQCHECEQTERENELDAMEQLGDLNLMSAPASAS